MTYETPSGRATARASVAKAWMDPAYRKRLLADATSAGRGIGIRGSRGRTPGRCREHRIRDNLVVCTLLHATVAGARLAAVWYKSFAYRSRAVRSARPCRGFRTRVAARGRVRVWDSSAEIRYLVIRTAKGTAKMSEDQLAAISRETRWSESQR